LSELLRFLARIGEYRGVDLHDARSPQAPLDCMILRDAVFRPLSRRIPWREDRGWARNIVPARAFPLEDDLSADPEDRSGVDGFSGLAQGSDFPFLSGPDDLDVGRHPQPRRERDVVVSLEPPFVLQELAGGERQLKGGVVDARIVV